MAQRIRFDYYFALGFIIALHGVSAIKVLAILSINYKIAKSLPRAYVPAATWIFNICTLFANELGGGYPLERIAASVAGKAGVSGTSETALVMWGRYLDSLGGLMPRWEILFNITVLRLISFNMDYYWSVNYRSSSPIEVKFTAQALLAHCPSNQHRRNNLIPQRCLNETASTSRPSHPRSALATTSHTRCIPHCTSPAPSSPSTTTSRSSDTHHSASLANAPSSTACGSSSPSSAWNSSCTTSTS